MDTASLNIRMLGEFSISTGKQTLSSNDSRSRKIWLLLAYMICCRKHPVSQDELISQLWGEDERSSNPGNALKTMFHRLRSMLNQLDGFSGYDLIIRQHGSYAWNTRIPVTLDADVFEALCNEAEAAQDEEQKMDIYLKALALYQGDFLPRCSAEAWVIPLASYYHNLYLQAIDFVLPRLEAEHRLEEAVALCRKAAEVEPYNEPLHCRLMQELIDLGDQQGAIAVYDNISNLLFTNFGVMPAEETRALYRRAMRIVNACALSILDVLEQLREPDAGGGALYCEYDFFKTLYQSKARSILRSGDTVHLGLISVSGENNAPLSRRSLDHCMDNLKTLICSSLRKGDVVSRCSVSQYVFMLPQANYENSCMVCDRIVKSFRRQYPHSPAQLLFSVQPIEPFL